MSSGQVVLFNNTFSGGPVSILMAYCTRTEPTIQQVGPWLPHNQDLTLVRQSNFLLENSLGEMDFIDKKLFQGQWWLKQKVQLMLHYCPKSLLVERAYDYLVNGFLVSPIHGRT